MSSYEPASPQTLGWVAAQCAPDATVVSTERLYGGITAAMDRIVVLDHHGQERRLVLRRWTDENDQVGDLVAGECAAFAALADTGVPAPQLVAADPSGERAGVRCVLMTEVPGEVLLAPSDLHRWVERLADQQAAIHAVPPTLQQIRTGWFSSEADYGWIDDPGLRREALAAATAQSVDSPDVFVHGDYQHFNVLWADEQVSGVVDWTMAGTGLIGIDVGHCRLNLAVLFSADAADHYLDRYQATAGTVVNSRDDLRALLVWDRPWETFIGTQVAGRATVDVPGMRDRVVETIRRSLLRAG